MSELLKEFCELAPKEWGAQLDDVSYPEGRRSFVWLNNVEGNGFGSDEEERCAMVSLSSDSYSAEAIIFLRSYLITEGWCVLSYNTGEGEHLELRGGTPMMHQPDAATLIEALVRACVALWRSK